MKKIGLIFIALISLQKLSAQSCLITSYAAQDTLNCGDSLFIQFNAFASAALQETFSASGPTDPGWATTSGAQFNNPYIPSPTNDAYFWMGPSATVPTSLTTIPFNVSGGGQICFDFVYAVQGQGSPIEGPDEYDEGITLQFNTGSGWQDIVYYAPNGNILPSNPQVNTPNVSAGPSSFTSWTSVCLPLPPGAQTTSTSFQWIQENNSGSCCDHWGLDNIEILVADTNFEIVSLNDGLNLGPAPATYPALTTGDSTFNFMYTNFFNDTCYTSFNSTMNPTDVGPDLILDCNQNVVQLQATGVSVNDNFTWSPITGLSNPNILNPTASPLDTTDYIFTSSCGVDTVTVNVVTNYAFSTSDDTTICVGDTAYLQVFGGAQTYAWTSVPNNNSISNPSIANPFFTPTTTTTYTVVTDSAGCIKTNSITVYVSNKVFGLLFTNNANCNGNNNGSILSIANGNLGPLSYNFTDSASYNVTQATGTFSNLAPGNYVLTVNDTLSACPITTNVTISGGQNIAIDTILATNPLCVGATNGSIEVLIVPAVAANYSLNGGTPQSSNIFSGLTDGTYTVTAQVGTCPAATQTITLSAPATVDLLFVDSTDASCGGYADGEIVVDANLGVAPYQFSLDNVIYQTDSFFIGLNAGNYVVYVQDFNGCKDSILTIINEPIPLALNNIITNAPQCFGGSNGSLSFNALNGSAPYQYSIDSGLTFGANNAFPLLAAGNYYIQASDNNGCLSAIDTVVINQPNALVVTLDSTDASTCGAADGIIYTTASQGTAPYTYSINNGISSQSTGTFTGLLAGNYTVLVTDNNSCTHTINAVISDFGAPSLSIASFDSVTCFGLNNAQVQLSVVGGTAPYQFNVDAGIFQADSLFTNLSGGLHTFIVQDNFGCQSTINKSIFEPALLSLSSTVDSVSCYGLADGSIILSASGGTSPFVFAIDDTSTAQLSNQFLNYAQGTYIGYVLDANACLASTNITLYQPDSLFISAVTVDSVSCFNAADGLLTVSAQGGVPAYQYSINNGASFVSSNTFTVDTGTYQIIVQDANACQSNVVLTNIYQPSLLILDSINSTLSNCGLANGSLTVQASGGLAPYTYQLNSGTPQSTGLFSNLSAQAYNLTVTDANLCSQSLSVSVNAIPSLSLSISSFDSVSCGGANDASVTLAATGGLAPYTFSVNGGTSQTLATFTNLSGGLNTFEVEDTLGCTATVSLTIYEPALLNVTATADSATCNSLADGQVTLSATGGGTNYLYALNNINTTQINNVFNGLMASVNMAYVIDENNCIDSVSITVSEPDTLIIIAVTAVDISCSALGRFEVSATGGTQPYSYNINGGAFQSLSQFSVATAGTYTLGVTDANGCPLATAIDSIIAPDPVTFTIDTATLSLQCNNSNNGLIAVSAAGGSSPYTYSINGGAFQTDSFFNNLAAGTYTLLVQDVFLCQSLPSTVTILQPNALTAQTSSTSILCNTDENGTITIGNLTGGTAPYTVEINGIIKNYTSNLVFDSLAAGTYSILITDANNCTLNLSETVGDVTALSVNLQNPTNASCFGVADGEINITATGGTPNYTYELNNGTITETIVSNTTATFDGLAGSVTGIAYAISITDANGCAISLTQSISQPEQLFIDRIDTSAMSCFGANDGTLSVIASGGSAPYTYLWSPSDQTAATASGLGAGVYTVTVTDQNNCSISGLQTILPVAPVLATIIPDSAFISMGDTVHLGVEVQNALGTTLQYAWSPSEGLSCTDCENPAVTTYNDIAYSVVVTDENGCTSFNFTEVYISVDRSLFYFIPNAFSPNADGVNDSFAIFGQDIQSVSLSVFNRWGEKVFEGENQYITWDGTYKGNLQNPGVYTFVATIKFLNDETIQQKGSVTLIR